MAAPEPGPHFRRNMNPRRPRRLRRRGLQLLLAAWLALAFWHTLKPLPPGLHVQGAFVVTPAASVQFLADITAQDGAGGMLRQRAIHEATLQLVRGARDFLVLDYFLFNGQGGPNGALEYRDGRAPVAAELIAALRDLKRAQPSLPVLVITDPINDYYRGGVPDELAALREEGIDVVVARLTGLRDSNPLYSATWRLLFGWWLPVSGEGWLPNLLDGAGPDLKFGALLRLPNFKANHRKLVLTGDGTGSLIGIVASANPHDASSAHSNVALRVEGEALRPLLASELAIARFSGWQGGALEAFGPPQLLIDMARETGRRSPASADAQRAPQADSATRVAVLTEGAIRATLLQRFDATQAGDAIDVAQFYLAERNVLRALLDASRRGVAVRVLLDPNRDAFGFEKSGVPNRPLANALVRASEQRIALRWYRTSGEQFHAKFASVRSGEQLWFTLGSANFTRRNIGDLNLEANVEVEADAATPAATQATTWFETLWNNAGGIPYTDATDAWMEDSRLRYWKSRYMEATGLSTF